MAQVRKSVLIWYSPQQMYTLVSDVASYPQFLPWCGGVQVHEEFLHAHEVPRRLCGVRAHAGVGLLLQGRWS